MTEPLIPRTLDQAFLAQILEELRVLRKLLEPASPVPPKPRGRKKKEPAHDVHV